MTRRPVSFVVGDRLESTARLAAVVALAALATVVLALGGVMLLQPAAGSGLGSLDAGTVTLNPADDSFVRVTDPSSNFDEDPLALSTTATGFPAGIPEDISYLRFDVAAITGTLTAARLRVYNRASPGASVRVAALSTVDDDWNGSDAGLGNETTITHDNASASVSQLDEQAGSSAPAWMVFESAELESYVADQISGDGLVTLRLEVLSSGFADVNLFEDRENTGATGHLPELVLEGVEMATATASPTPTDGPSATRTLTATATSSPTATAEASQTAIPTGSPSVSPTQTVSATATSTVAPSLTVSASHTPSPTASTTPTTTATATAAPSQITSPEPTPTSTPPPTASPPPSPTSTSTPKPSASPTPTGTSTSTATVQPPSPAPTGAPTATFTSTPEPPNPNIYLPALQR